MATVTQRVRELRRSGKSDDEIRAAKPAADFDATDGGGFIRHGAFIQMMLDAVAR